ncbi:MAG: hypothetical protein CL946_11035 [Ectothiorhodospiraceae bacterium]|nr:hypothetical protein [Ectothiorhodospiraceae bacterium]
MFPRIDKGPIEYYLLIAPAFNVEKQRECLRFTFQTNEEFHHFRYYIAIEHSIEDKKITFNLKGLKSAGMDMPAVGRAESNVDMFDLAGEYEVEVFKPGDIKNDFTIYVRSNKPKVSKDIENEDAFLMVSTEAAESV